MEIDYRKYSFTWKDWLTYFVMIIAKGADIGYLFYDSFKMCILCVPFFVMDYKSMKEERLNRQKRDLTMQFRSMMEALVTSLTAGDEIIAGLKVNIPVEKLLKDFGVRSGIEDIDNFANVVAAAKRSGGNLIRIIEKTVRSISDKISLEEEMETMISAKKLEEKIMMVMPYGILFYLRISNGGFLDVLYHNGIGIVLMTIFLAGVYLANMWATRIMDIPV